MIRAAFGTGLPARIAGLSPRRRRAAVFGCGLCFAATMPPIGAVPLLIPAVVGVLWLLDGVRTVRGAFAIGWLFAFAFFCAGMWWIGISFTARGGVPVWTAPFAIVGLCAGLALFGGLAGAATWSLPADPRVRIFGFAAIWAALEWLRGTILTGFPWNLAAHAWADVLPAAQWVAWIGSYGLSALTLLLAGLPALALAGDRRRTLRVLAAAAAGVAVLICAGWGRMAVLDPTESVPGVVLRLVQPNIAQKIKWRRDLRERHMETLVGLSRLPHPPGRAPTHVIWPETAAPFFLAASPERLADLGARAVPKDGLLISGAPRIALDVPVGDPADRPRHNALHAIDSAGRVTATYDKHHLVPFGEYVPLRGIVPWNAFGFVLSDFTPGPGPRTMEVGGLPPFSPLICYEAIFPGKAAADSEPRPLWLLNVTNDAWFGRSAGPHQHFAISRYRAIEEGLPLIRVANTGISAVVDPIGRTGDFLPLEARGVLDVNLPRALSHRTVFARYPALMTGLILALLAICVSIFARFSRNKSK